ncbi:MAG: zf-HC2 domain-containing protein [Gaiellaceae bacterium]
MNAREAASARLDGEVSELDVARLGAHLLVCPACRAYAAAIAGIAAELRAAPLEWPSLEHVALGISPRRRRMPVFSAAVALVAAVAGFSFALGSVLGSHATPSRTAVGSADVVRLRQDSADQHLLAMLNAFEFPLPARNGRMHAI